jgi:hypothetical protein
MIRLLRASRNTYYVHIYIIILNKCIQREICLQKKKKKIINMNSSKKITEQQCRTAECDIICIKINKKKQYNFIIG